mmetsp:Transcript_348/g.698  ORF Transcript_348/g.698 Transcript_348/m.698 type:complete len:122 (-) Transcript_348:249-614(-)
MEYALCSFEKRVPAAETVTIECEVLDDLRGLEQVVEDVQFRRSTPNVTKAFVGHPQKGGYSQAPVVRLRVFKSLSAAGFSLVSQSSSSTTNESGNDWHIDKYTFQRPSKKNTASRKRGRSS